MTTASLTGANSGMNHLGSRKVEEGKKFESTLTSNVGTAHG